MVKGFCVFALSRFLLAGVISCHPVAVEEGPPSIGSFGSAFNQLHTIDCLLFRYKLLHRYFVFVELYLINLSRS
jgi:hypothetical protein